MSEWLHAFVLRMKAARHRRKLERDLEEELAFHLEMKAEEVRAGGVSAEGAAQAARRRLGNPTALKESLRDRWTFPLAESVFQDARHAARALAKAPGFAAVAVLSLAIGIGANTSIFTVFNGLFLRSLPVRNPQDLRIVYWTGVSKHLVESSSGWGSYDGRLRTSSSFSVDAFNEMRKQPVFSLAGFAPFQASLFARSQAHWAPAYVVTGGYFKTLGVEAALGRTLVESDDASGAPYAVVISWRLHQRLYGGDRSVLGADLHIDKTPYVVVGVLPQAFAGLSQASPVDVYVPMARARELTGYRPEEPGFWWMQVLGRLAPGVTDNQARAALDLSLSHVAAARGEALGKKLEAPRSVVMDGRTGHAFRLEQEREFLVVLLIMVGLVLLTACANVANLLLARGSARSRELAVRRALGAGRFRIARYLLTESLMLAVAGGTLGLVLAQLGTTLLARMVFPDPEIAIEIHPDAAVLAFTCGLSLVTALLFGTLPAIRAAQVEPNSCLKRTGAGGAGLRHRLANTLIVVQVAAAVVLVVGAGLFARTLVNLGRVELGFRPDHLLMFHVDPKRSGYEGQRLADVYRRIQDHVSAIPGVQAVTATRQALISGWMSNRSFYTAGRQPKPGERTSVYLHVVGGRFLTITGTPLLLGRDLAASDNEHSARVAVINAAAARKWFDGNPVGREFSFNSNLEKPVRIVGVAADAKYDKIRAEIEPTVYLPWMQNLEDAGGMHFQLRTSVDPSSVAPAVLRAVAGIDPTLPVSDVRTQEQVIERALSKERTFALLGGFFSVVAIMLVAIGIYGVLAYAVARRTSEFGIRLALGATPGQIRWLVMRGTLALILCGALIGVPAALAAIKLVKARLFGVEPADSFTLALAAVVILLSALAAAWLPSERAAKADPAVSLRYE